MLPLLNTLREKMSPMLLLAPRMLILSMLMSWMLSLMSKMVMRPNLSSMLPSSYPLLKLLSLTANQLVNISSNLMPVNKILLMPWTMPFKPS
jgi:hypothetical protein